LSSVTLEENDPDTLQMLDEADLEWVMLWKVATNKNDLTNSKIEGV